VLTGVPVPRAQSGGKRPDDSPVRLGCPAALLTDPRERGDERLFTIEQAARSIERLPAEVVAQGSVRHPLSDRHIGDGGLAV